MLLWRQCYVSPFYRLRKIQSPSLCQNGIWTSVLTQLSQNVFLPYSSYVLPLSFPTLGSVSHSYLSSETTAISTFIWASSLSSVGSSPELHESKVIQMTLHSLPTIPLNYSINSPSFNDLGSQTYRFIIASIGSYLFFF